MHVKLRSRPKHVAWLVLAEKLTGMILLSKDTKTMYCSAFHSSVVKVPQRASTCFHLLTLYRAFRSFVYCSSIITYLQFFVKGFFSSFFKFWKFLFPCLTRHRYFAFNTVGQKKPHKAEGCAYKQRGRKMSLEEPHYRGTIYRLQDRST